MAEGKWRKIKVVRKGESMSFERLDLFLKNTYSSFLDVFLSTGHQTIFISLANQATTPKAARGNWDGGEKAVSCHVGMRDCAGAVSSRRTQRS